MARWSRCLDLTSTGACRLELFDGLMIAGLLAGLALAVWFYVQATRGLPDDSPCDRARSRVAGYDRYKDSIEEQGWERVKGLGPVLGPLHPLVADNVAMLRHVSGKDEVSFRMSGTEAVMAAVRLARFNTGRTLMVCSPARITAGGTAS